MIPRLAAALLLALALSAPAAAKERPLMPEFPQPHRYGAVVLDRGSTRTGMAPVTFEHWRHRLLYTCRLCHVDVGFAMEAAQSGISADSIRGGLHCGACHDGATTYLGQPIFAACGGPGDASSRACKRCHTKKSTRAAYEAFARNKPRDASGLIDWEEAERRAFDRPVDWVEGISPRQSRLGIDRNFSIESVGTWLGDVAFSHSKHARWNGCEGCHPEIFPSTSRGVAKYRMKDIDAGRYCGACHGKVAFPSAACLRCHALPPAQ